MAYGDSDGVELWLGRTTADSAGYFVAANITLAIAAADLIVDSINSDASASNKTLASNMIAADILFNRFALAQTNGLNQISQTNGEPAATIAIRKVPSDLAIQILKTAESTIAYTTTTARDANDNYLG